MSRGFPWHLSGKYLPASAGDMGLILDSGRSHMLQTNEAVCHNYWACALEPVKLNH